MDDIQPLNELGEREVKQQEIEEIMEKMKVLGEDFDSLDNEIKPLLAKLEALLKDVDAMIEMEKARMSRLQMKQWQSSTRNWQIWTP